MGAEWAAAPSEAIAEGSDDPASWSYPSNQTHWIQCQRGDYIEPNGNYCGLTPNSSVPISLSNWQHPLAAASAPDEHGACPAGDLRLNGFELGALPVAGLEVLLSLCAAEEGITCLNLASNALRAEGAKHVAEAIKGHVSTLQFV